MKMMAMFALLVSLLVFGLTGSSSAQAPPTAPGLSGDATVVTGAIDKAMRFLVGNVNQASAQYGDYVVFCGMSIEKKFPQYKEILAIYKKAITENDTFLADYPYWSVCHVMAFDLIGNDAPAKEIFAKLKAASANEGKWDGAEYHLGWYLYACIVAGDNELRDKTLAYLSESLKQRPDKLHYFTAYCVWKIYERTKDKKYKRLFTDIVKGLKPFSNDYLEMAPTDGHMGMALTVFCTAYAQTHDKKYKELCRKLADILLATQEKPGSWNEGNIAYTIMPAEGLTAFLNMR